MDPNQRKDPGWHAHFLLLHFWSDDLSRAWVLAQRLEEAAGGCLRSTLPVLCLQLVSSDFHRCLCFVSTQVALTCLLFLLVRWYSESARWLVLRNRFDEAVKNLQRVARINGKPEVIEKLTKEVIYPSL